MTVSPELADVAAGVTASGRSETNFVRIYATRACLFLVFHACTAPATTRVRLYDTRVQRRPKNKTKKNQAGERKRTRVVDILLFRRVKAFVVPPFTTTVPIRLVPSRRHSLPIITNIVAGRFGHQLRFEIFVFHASLVPTACARRRRASVVTDNGDASKTVTDQPPTATRCSRAHACVYETCRVGNDVVVEWAAH